MPTLFDSMALAFLQASLTCALAGAVLWLALAVAARAWPALAMQRSVWLLSQCALAAAFVLALLPQAAPLSVMPAIPVGPAAQASGVQSAVVQSDAASSSGVPSSALQSASVRPVAALAAVAPGGDDIAGSWLLTAARAWLALYGAGLLANVARRVAAQRGLQGLLASARLLPAGERAAHPAFGAEPLRELARRGLQVFETDAPVSPMLFGVLRPRLLLPRHMRGFSTEQQQLIVAHELTHWRRRDALLLHASLALQTVFWFNPALRMLGERLTWAQELGCDRQVLAGRPRSQHKQYAAALVAQLKAQQANRGTAAATMAFGDTSLATLSARVRLIRDSGARPFGAAGRCAVTLSVAALLLASLMLRPAFAWRAEADVPPPSGIVATALPQWNAPLAQVRVSSFYGVARKTLVDGHHGIDFVARSGTPVLATAAGVVSASTDLFEGGVKYGKVIVIDHGNGLRSLYAHLGRRSVQVGDAVTAGQPIGLSGATGRVTGPHLHLEAFQDEQRIDPQRLLAGLDERATPSALRARAGSQAN